VDVNVPVFWGICVLNHTIASMPKQATNNRRSQESCEGHVRDCTGRRIGKSDLVCVCVPLGQIGGSFGVGRLW
jgi:hypothetical protein